MMQSSTTMFLGGVIGIEFLLLQRLSDVNMAVLLSFYYLRGNGLSTKRLWALKRGRVYDSTTRTFVKYIEGR